jgi:methyl-accepting chemotaxis protein
LHAGKDVIAVRRNRTGREISLKVEGANYRLAADPSSVSESIRLLPRRFRLPGRAYPCRRRILVNRGYQIRSAAMGVTGMGFLVALTVILLSRSHSQSAQAILQVAPGLGETLARAQRVETIEVVSGGVLFMAGVLIAGILESRKTAGPVLNLRRRLEELRSGRLGARVLLRRHDHFPEVADAFNEMANALRARAEGELATLRRISSQLSDLLKEEARGNKLGVMQSAETLQQSLEDLRRRKAELLEP